ncbi:MAG: hypothetical protein RJP96_14835 [Algiphilus sp.]|uniref:hypothetical protein n=2 Tax=Algiphilus sp. TaxID=1872431 RepID=UPI0032EFFD12
MGVDRTLDEDTAAELREGIAEVIRDVMEQPPSRMAFQCADAILERIKQDCAGERLNIPAQPKVDAEAIRADWHAGYSVAQVMKRNNCGRTVAYKYHPNGGKKKRAAPAAQEAGQGEGAAVTGGA